MITPKRWLAGLGIVALWGDLACGGGSDGGGPPDPGQKTVLVANNEFQPLTVTISAGDTIFWSWVNAPAAIGHNIISTGAPSFLSKGTTTTPPVLGVDFFDAPQSHQVIFPTAGTYEYFCSNHGTTGGGGNTGMHGTVQVNP